MRLPSYKQSHNQKSIEFSSRRFHNQPTIEEHLIVQHPLKLEQYFLTYLKQVWHDGLIFKLEQDGISGNLLKLFQTDLSNRKQRVVLNVTFFDYSSIESGVPQGYVFDPLLFLERNIKSNVKFFANDTMLFSIVSWNICKWFESRPWCHNTSGHINGN